MDNKLVVSRRMLYEILDSDSERTHLRDAFFNRVEQTVSISEEQNGFTVKIDDLDLSFLQESKEKEVLMITDTISYPHTFNKTIQSVSIFEEQNGFTVKVDDLDLSFLQESEEKEVLMITDTMIPQTMFCPHVSYTAEIDLEGILRSRMYLGGQERQFKVNSKQQNVAA